MKIDVLSEKIIIKLANILENKQNVKFEYNDLFYEIFELDKFNFPENFAYLYL